MNKRFLTSLIAAFVVVSTFSTSALADSELSEEEERRENYSLLLEEEERREDYIAEKKQEETLITKWSDYRDYLVEYNEKIAEGDEYSHYYAIRIQIIEHLIERIQNALEN